MRFYKLLFWRAHHKIWKVFWIQSKSILNSVANNLLFKESEIWSCYPEMRAKDHVRLSFKSVADPPYHHKTKNTNRYMIFIPNWSFNLRSLKHIFISFSSANVTNSFRMFFSIAIRLYWFLTPLKVYIISCDSESSHQIHLLNIAERLKKCNAQINLTNYKLLFD